MHKPRSCKSFLNTFLGILAPVQGLMRKLMEREVKTMANENFKSKIAARRFSTRADARLENIQGTIKTEKLTGASFYINDVGEEGLGIYLVERVEIAEKVSVEFKHMGKTYKANGEVMWCQPHEGGFRAGVHFPDDIVKKLYDFFAM